MQLNRPFILSFVLGGLLCTTFGCAARGTDPPIIESLGPPPGRNLGDSIRIATANLWGVSVLGFDWADDIDERFAAMAERLASNQPMLDVVLIQEAWKDAARRALLEHEGVARSFPFRVDAVDQPGGSGLVILSRFPIETAHFERFRAQGRCIKFWEGDCISGKGILTVRLRVGDRSIWIGDTHLIACYSRSDDSETACGVADPNGDDRWQQIVEARQTIESLVGNDPVILGGDFNLTRTSRYYPLMTGAAIPAHPLVDRTVPSTSSPRRATDTPRGWTEPEEKVLVPNRLDYLWTRPGTEVRWQARDNARPIFTEPVVLASGKSVALSDHPILAAEFCLVQIHDPNDQCLPFASNTQPRH